MSELETLQAKLRAIKRIGLATNRLQILLSLVDQDVDCEKTLDELFVDLNEIREIISAAKASA